MNLSEKIKTLPRSVNFAGCDLIPRDDVLKLLEPHIKVYEKLQEQYGMEILKRRQLEAKHEALMAHLQNIPILKGYDQDECLKMEKWKEELYKHMEAKK